MKVHGLADLSSIVVWALCRFPILSAILLAAIYIGWSLLFMAGQGLHMIGIVGIFLTLQGAIEMHSTKSFGKVRLRYCIVFMTIGIIILILQGKGLAPG